jgi:hypothetical protein
MSIRPLTMFIITGNFPIFRKRLRKNCAAYPAMSIGTAKQVFEQVDIKNQKKAEQYDEYTGGLAEQLPRKISAIKRHEAAGSGSSCRAQYIANKN